jgi:hypothetical protein
VDGGCYCTIHKKCDKINFNTYHGISQLSTSYNILSNIFFSNLSPCINESIMYHWYGFWHNTPTTDHIFCIHQILEKKWDYNETVHHLFIDLKKTYDSVTREVLYNILMQLGVPMKLIRLFKLCLNEAYNEVCIGKHLIVFLFKMV